MSEYLIISTSVDLLRAAADEIVFISSDGNYSSFMFKWGESRVVTMQLGRVEFLIEQQLVRSGQNFIRIGKSLIINRNFISYINLSKQQLVLADGCTASHCLTASRDALRQLKELLENDL
ncbi:MAG: LytTR family transcriptional regulator DNA-binding domain-containing protein [Bacteroidales bacterium]|nr:LytTR family transcriptional regulator DNA-binding domain-containing protein [Bacteroidales bacterium]